MLFVTVAAESIEILFKKLLARQDRKEMVLSFPFIISKINIMRTGRQVVCVCLEMSPGGHRFSTGVQRIW
jgi:hypothetical protein